MKKTKLREMFGLIMQEKDKQRRRKGGMNRKRKRNERVVNAYAEKKNSKGGIEEVIMRGKGEQLQERRERNK